MKIKNKKIAVCLFGMPPSKCNKHINVVKDISFTCWEKNIIKKNNPDFFIHCWDENDPDKLDSKFKPKIKKFENNIVFDKDGSRSYDYDDGGGTVINMFKSQAYSAKKSIELKKRYETANKFHYDLVMMSRIDLLWLTEINLKILDNNYFYISNWNQSRNGKRFWRPLGSKSNYTTIRRKYRKILDYWFISNSKNIDIFSNLFDFIPEWLIKNNEKKVIISNHTLKKDYLIETGLWDIKKFLYFEHYDHNIQRYFYKFKDNERKFFRNLMNL